MKYIEVKNLTFQYGEKKTILKNIDLDFESNSRYVIVGLNGCGKSTLMKLIGGKTLCQCNAISVLGKDPFRDTCLNNHICFLDNQWGTKTVAYVGYNMPLQSGMQVKEMMVKLKQDYPERNEELMNVLKINPEWHLNAISEGQRKRVQLYLGLIKPFDICLLDEITVNLDILIKDRFMNYLKKESIDNNACVIYITHIFDGLDDWCTDLMYMNRNGNIDYFGKKPNEPIYPYLLKKMKQEDYEFVEEEENKDYANKKNAGGYSDGVLIDYKITNK